MASDRLGDIDDLGKDVLRFGDVANEVEKMDEEREATDKDLLFGNR